MKREIYTEQPSQKGKCKVCGDFQVYRYEHKGKIYSKPYYFRAFLKDSWFRGDDQYLGKICKKCIKEGREEEMVTTNKTER